MSPQVGSVALFGEKDEMHTCGDTDTVLGQMLEWESTECKNILLLPIN